MSNILAPPSQSPYAPTPEEIAASELKNSPIFRRYVRPCCAEIMGTLIFTFASCMCVTASIDATQAIIVSITQGAVILALYGSLAPIGKGHFNPAVTFAAWLGGNISFVLVFFHVICQVLGAFLGAILVRLVLLRQVYLVTASATVPTVNFGYSGIGQTILMELIGTFFWSLVVLLTVVDGNRPLQLASSFVGTAVFVASLLSYNISKASLNPARAFGATMAYNVFAGTGDWSEHYVFWIGPFLGATIASFFYRLLFANDDKRLLFKK